MKGAFVFGAIAASVASAWEYPDCEPDNCYRNLIDPRFKDEAPKFCFDFLSGTTTAPSAIPTDFNNCGGNVKRVSSACSCITYTATHTTGVSTTTKPTETPTKPTETPTTKPTQTPTTKPTGTQTPTTNPTGTSTKPTETTTSWTTSTVCTTTTRTITKCPPNVTSCPGGGHTTVVTETIPVSTTVCPVTPITPVKPSSSMPQPGNNSTSTQYTTQTYTISKCPPGVPNCPIGSVSTTVYPTGTTVVVPSWTSQKITQQPSNPPSNKPPTPTVGVPSSRTTGPVQVTAAAGHVVGSLNVVAAVAGLVALL
ncbi:Uncharacterized protein TPAR_02103 [Tolypocladium paradoxum]|uniref:Uncharacterized protein n=1 Tax=Tolypocladium paradoxum TaxID=94208 RepID=A0A2S4L5K0_9HYPO|nr:Uncharacterized protein TPAR_02103 [Tolypocladium paradoxum]